MLQKERETEGNTFAGKEKFLTSAYKKQLQENKLWQEEEERKAALEEDVTKKEDLGSFYVNLLTRNEAYGGRRSPPKDTVVSRDKDSAQRSGKDNESTSDVNDQGKHNKTSGDVPRSIDEHADSVAFKTDGKRQEDTKKTDGDTNKKRPHGSPPRKEPEHDNVDATAGDDTTKLARRNNDESTVSAARERYLKRKAQTQL